MIPVILSGGSGTRLWPISRKTHPKQFWPLASEASMLQETCKRLGGHDYAQDPIIVCNTDHRFFVAHQLEELGLKDASIILEPMGRNTAPATAAAALHALNKESASENKDPILLVLPADHVINDIPAFHAILEQGELLADQGHLVTFGIVPTGPETGYGYIKGGTRLNVDSKAMPIERFVEKPDKTTAESHVSSGDYFWNSGMFMFRASRFLEELEKFAPAMLKATKAAYDNGIRDMDFIRLNAETFEQCPSDSIDYAVMEHTKDAVVIPLDAGWNDVGSWSALWEIGEKDGAGNVMMGDVLALESENCYLRSEGRLLATVGIDNLVVVDTPDVVMVAPLDQVQKVKELVSQLSNNQRHEIDVHAQVHRPWGCFQGIDVDERYQVKRISVRPGASLSLQMHHHRAEHWIVVNGTAKVTCGDKTFLLSENESTYIPIGTKHRLENPGQIPLDIIEVQSGSYLGEDDIVRFEDIYGRSEEQ
ncbi:MAG TPA: mannose-1-phosphate guanylyltransferase/mannose-6-phosphate isomerase [Thiolapillus brandeum]|uniref:mannose-1-phosphate guanylyltransferase n=1 Tax=Thiolapillus brandeum TaxID=1076588 RepID=A0A831NW32_9GAMM|nr:mannose-1-phosphate guanylyltransferase/mannose-6-phosphate isomerase [Thiolapillus brandeum]